MRDFYLLAVLVLVAFRVTRLVTRDDLPPILWLRDRLVGGWRPLTEQERAEGPNRRLRAVQDVDFGHGPVAAVYLPRWRWVPWWLKELLSCPWCVSAYISGALVAATDILVGVPSPWLTAPAVWAGAAILASRSSL